MRTSLTFLTLLAAASSAVAAPVPAHDARSGPVQKVVSGHRRSDSRVVVDMQEHLVSPSTTSQDQLTSRQTDKSNKSNMNKGQNMSNEYKSSKNAMESETNRVKEAVKKIENRRSRSTKRAVVSLFPEQDPGPKAGMVDAFMKDADAHVIQTPGQDKTIVDVKTDDMDAKVNLPKDAPAPVTDATGQPAGQPQNEDEELFRGKGVSLNSKMGPVDGVVDDGNGGPQGVEVSY
jgi:TolA-binding protein